MTSSLFSCDTRRSCPSYSFRSTSLSIGRRRLSYAILRLPTVHHHTLKREKERQGRLRPPTHLRNVGTIVCAHTAFLPYTTSSKTFPHEPLRLPSYPISSDRTANLPSGCYMNTPSGWLHHGTPLHPRRPRISRLVRITEDVRLLGAA